MNTLIQYGDLVCAKALKANGRGEFKILLSFSHNKLLCNRDQYSRQRNNVRGYIDDVIDNKIVYFVSEFAAVLLVYQLESIIGIF